MQNMYNNYYFLNIDSSKNFNLAFEPTSSEFIMPKHVFAKDILGKRQIDIDDNFVSQVSIEKNRNGEDCIVLFHITMDAFLSDVLRHGLVPKQGRLSEKLGEENEYVYLFPNEVEMNNALMGWMGEAYEDIAEEDGVVFEEMLLHSLIVKIPVANYLQYVVESEVAFEFLIDKTIPSSWITYHKKQ